MRAARVHAWNQPPSIEEMGEPVRAAGRSIVRMAAATVGHIDRTVWSGRFLTHPPLPYIPGVEAAGIVVASDRFAAGQRVWLRGGGLGTAIDGTWCELIAAPDEALGLLPDDVPMALGSAFFSPCTSAWTALHDVAKVQPGERAPELLARLADGRLRLGVREFALAHAAEALEWITRRGHRGRAVLVPDRQLG